jgi:DNA-binding transcriptional regulator YiaG
MVQTYMRGGTMDFSEKIKYVREKLILSQEDLARALNVSFATINRWENSKNKPVRMAQVAFSEFCIKHKISFDESEGK